MVLPEECEEMVGRSSFEKSGDEVVGCCSAGVRSEVEGAVWGVVEIWCSGSGVWAGEGEWWSSSSGLAMRKPPSDCDRLRSPFMLYRESSE